ncbi:hydroxymethylbilane synthase [Sphingorhabdus soli]|uniref:Porphobilinogen deaminase n=1 Tax=Flavisphingopyxis soli TaxID=2601267 RepID=A0A5C6UQC7_9SPHN|nr:hydroxymethylbilane synthase [Sphingorhabdus soli]
MPSPSSEQPFRIGTRASPLALAQATLTRDALIAVHGWAQDAVVLVPMIASGDRIQDRALAEIGGKELWTRELDRALANGEIDCAVHSLKDVETIRPAAFVIAAILERADPRDRLIGAASIADLPRGARIGTASPRRAAQLLHARPDLDITLLRGNVATRLAKLDAGEVDATLLAAAGLDRLGMNDIGVALDIDTMLPAPSQGAIGIEVLADNDGARAAVTAIDHDVTHRCVAAERALLAELGGDCRSPVAAHARMRARGIILTAHLYATDGSAMVSGEYMLDDDNTPAGLARDLLAEAPAAIRALFAG